MPSDIILIGPVRAGKSTLAQLLAEKLSWPHVALDELRVVLLLPSPDAQESIQILNERTKDLVGSFGQGFNWNEHFVRHRSNYDLAKFIVYTKGKTPEETRDEILNRVDR